MKTSIKDVKVRAVFDSRGVETIEIDVFTEGNGMGRVAAPFGAPGSRGEFEAPAYAPGGIFESINLVSKEIIPTLRGKDAADQKAIDDLLKNIDGTPNFERLGGNASSSISIACAKAAANTLGVPLFRHLSQQDQRDWIIPYPLGNVIGGGAHSKGPAPDMQEHLILPIGASNIREAVSLNIKVHEVVGEILERRDAHFVGGMDDERAWTADLNDIEALEVLTIACDTVKRQTGKEFRLGLDLAADRLWVESKGKYVYSREGVERTTEQQLEFIGQLIEKLNLYYVEDAFRSSDYESFAKLNKLYGHCCLVCADDLYASNSQRAATGISVGSANAAIIKPNQIGTITGAHETVKLERSNNYKIVLSHRSGETSDDSIAHLAVAWDATIIKTGVLGGERLVKLNELIRIAEEFKGQVKMACIPYVEHE